MSQTPRYRFACGTDNDGFPTCMGDGGECGYSEELGERVCDRLADLDADLDAEVR